MSYTSTENKPYGAPGDATLRESGSARRTEKGVNTLLAAGMIKLVVCASYRLDRVPDALNALLERRVIEKTVVTP